LRASRFGAAPDGALLLPPGSSSAEKDGSKGASGDTFPFSRTL